MSDIVLTPVQVIDKGLQDYSACWQAMKDFTDTRTVNTIDQCWFVEHPAVLTLGQAGKPEHILQHSDIPIIHTDRGGQVTYHAPGQLILYFLIDLKRKNISVRNCVAMMEQAVINVLALYGLSANIKQGAPGVYINDAKIAALGLRVRRGCTYHGLSVNVDMDLTPFTLINPCGYEGLQVAQLRDKIAFVPVMKDVQEALLQQVIDTFQFELLA